MNRKNYRLFLNRIFTFVMYFLFNCTTCTYMGRQLTTNSHKKNLITLNLVYEYEYYELHLIVLF